MTTGSMQQLTLELTPAECGQLKNLLQQALGETRVEVHRTHSPGPREQVLEQESLIRGMLEKINRLG